jgi:hypothetical protein
MKNEVWVGIILSLLVLLAISANHSLTLRVQRNDARVVIGSYKTQCIHLEQEVEGYKSLDKIYETSINNLLKKISGLEQERDAFRKAVDELNSEKEQ